MPSSHHSIATRRYQCRHILTGGRRCGSPSLRGEEFCYYHHTSRRPKPRVPHDPFLHPPNETEFTLPVPEDRTAISQSIGEIMNKLAANALDPRRAGLLLYALQIASANLPKSAPVGQAPDTVEELIIDPVLGPLAPVAEVDDGMQRCGGLSLALRSCLKRTGLVAGLTAGLNTALRLDRDGGWWRLAKSRSLRCATGW